MKHSGGHIKTTKSKARFNNLGCRQTTPGNLSGRTIKEKFGRVHQRRIAPTIWRRGDTSASAAFTGGLVLTRRAREKKTKNEPHVAKFWERKIGGFGVLSMAKPVGKSHFFHDPHFGPGGGCASTRQCIPPERNLGTGGQTGRTAWLGTHPTLTLTLPGRGYGLIMIFCSPV